MYQIYRDAPLVQEMHFWCTKKVKTFGSGQGKGKISYAWSRLYKMLSATYCVYAHRGWIGLKDSRPQVQDFHVNVPSWSFQQTLDWKHFVNSLRRGNTLNSIHVHRSCLVAWSVQFRVTVISGEKRVVKHPGWHSWPAWGHNYLNINTIRVSQLLYST